MKKYIKLIVFLMIICSNVYGQKASNNPYFDKSSNKYKDLLFVLNRDERIHYFWSDSKTMLDNYIQYCLEGRQLYNAKEYEKAIDKYISACKIITYRIAYYQLGLCLMDIGNYEDAEKAFEYSLKLHSFYRPIEHLYTYDNNGLKREYYFAYYNIACIKSMQNRIGESFNYLCEALFNGYPYIDHLIKDTDLKNLLVINEGMYRKRIENIYKEGFNNTVARKGFKRNWGGAPLEYYFINERIVYSLRGGVGSDTGGWLEGEYEVRNYQIFIKNVVYHYNEDAFENNFDIPIKLFDTKDKQSSYIEIPVDGYVGRFGIN
jgi:tetratricopeptide (TPR) repeat protein